MQIVVYLEVNVHLIRLKFLPNKKSSFTVSSSSSLLLVLQPQWCVLSIPESKDFLNEDPFQPEKRYKVKVRVKATFRISLIPQSLKAALFVSTSQHISWSGSSQKQTLHCWSFGERKYQVWCHPTGNCFNDQSVGITNSSRNTWGLLDEFSSIQSSSLWWSSWST